MCVCVTTGCGPTIPATAVSHWVAQDFPVQSARRDVSAGLKYMHNVGSNGVGGMDLPVSKDEQKVWPGSSWGFPTRIQSRKIPHRCAQQLGL